MLFARPLPPLDDQHWRRINMRKVAHLVAAESLNNLYNRHWPRINSLRFRHTITNYKNGVVESFAPSDEWAYIQHWLSQKFLALDPTLIREIRAIMNPSYDLVNEVMSKIDKTNFKKITNRELALLLIDILDYPLGDIYKLNVVQIEYSLNHALNSRLELYEPSQHDRNLLLAQLIAPGELTVAQEEEVSFAELIKKARKLNASSPYDNETIKKMFLKHVGEYAPKHCAYGELPPSEKDYVSKYTSMYGSDTPLLTRAAAVKNIKEQHAASKDILERLSDPLLTELSQLMAEIGVFRDQNKAKLGETVVRRLRVLDEISERSGESRANIDFYLAAELALLLDDGERVPKDVLASRKHDGVCFVRSEDLIIGEKPFKRTSSHQANKPAFHGVCASPGKVSGVVKIIHSKHDAKKMRPGDIMVAIGTDFDLIEIMNMSKGIITEEGGLLSHASVVSRELKKPCLIGVHDATRLFKDGDRVILNATDGTITKKV